MKSFDIERYKTTDRYTLKELAEAYRAGTVNEKSNLIEELSKEDLIPASLARIILQDKNPEPRRTLARHSPSLTLEDNEGEVNLIEIMLKDADELTKCSLYENPNFSPRMEYFAKATPIERLAMVRNPRVDMELISKIYDPEDKEISLSDADRTELVRAFCSNREIVTETNKDIFDHEDFMDAAFNVMSYGDLWEKALKWLDRNNEIVRLTIKTFGTRDSKAVTAYESLKDKKHAPLRKAIFENPAVQQTDYQKAYQYLDLLKAGLTDEDEWIRYICIATHPALSVEEVQKIIESKKKWEFRGLMFNRHLSVESMALVSDKLKEHDDLYQSEIRTFRDRYEAAQATQTGAIARAEEIVLEAVESKDPNKILAAKTDLLEKNLSAARQDLQKIKSEMLTGPTVFWYVVGGVIVLQLLRGCSS